MVQACWTWGFKRLNKEIIDTLNLLGTLHLRPDAQRPRALDHRRGEASNPGARGASLHVHAGARTIGRVTVTHSCSWTTPRIALRHVFLHLAAELNFYRLFNEAIENFDAATVVARQSAAMAEAGLEQGAA